MRAWLFVHARTPVRGRTGTVTSKTDDGDVCVCVCVCVCVPYTAREPPQAAFPQGYTVAVMGAA